MLLVRKLIRYITRGFWQFITKGVWRLAVYDDGRLIKLNQSANISAADPFIWRLSDGRYIILFESYAPFERPKKGVIYLGIYNPVSNTLSNVQLLHEEEYHISFPSLVAIQEQVYLCYEASKSGEVKVRAFDESSLQVSRESHVLLSNVTALDPYLFASDCGIFLVFSSGKDDEMSTRLYHACDLKSKFVEHDCSPISKGRKFGRVASTFFSKDQNLYRAAQSNIMSYGDTMYVFRIDQISATQYKEVCLGKMTRPIGVSNMHTRTEYDGICIVDYDTFGISVTKWRYLWNIIKTKVL